MPDSPPSPSELARVDGYPDSDDGEAGADDAVDNGNSSDSDGAKRKRGTDNSDSDRDDMPRAFFN